MPPAKHTLHKRLLWQKNMVSIIQLAKGFFANPECNELGLKMKSIIQYIWLLPIVCMKFL